MWVWSAFLLTGARRVPPWYPCDRLRWVCCRVRTRQELNPYSPTCLSRSTEKLTFAQCCSVIYRLVGARQYVCRIAWLVVPLPSEGRDQEHVTGLSVVGEG